MDLLSIIPLIITILFLACIVIGFLVGLIRGLKKTLIRTIWVVVIGVLLIFITTPIALSILKADISWIPGISGILQGSTSIEGFITTTLVKSMEGITADQVQPLISFMTSIIAMVISGILFLVFFILLKYLSLPFYWILNIFIGKSKGGKKRLLGGAVGALLGVLVFTFISTPIVGYVNIVDKVDQISAGLVQTPYTASADNDHSDGIVSQSPIGEILDSFNNSVVIKVYDAIGLKKLQVVIFNQTSAVKISGETIKLNDEIDSIGNVIIQVLPFTDGTIDINNFEAILNDPEQLEYFSTTVSGLLNSLYDSKLFSSILNTAIPTVVSFMEETITNALTSTPDLDPALAEPLTNLLSDFFSGIANSDAEKISDAFTSVIDVMTIIPKIQSEEGLASLTADDFSKFGNVLDSFIASGLIKQETIGELVPSFLDMALNAMGENAEIPEALTTFIGELKASFKSGDISYANEIKVIGELVTCFTSLDLSGENLSGETFKNLGASLDRAFSHDSKIFTRELVDNLVIGLIDMVSTTDIPELEGFEEVFELVKEPFVNHEITSYEKEFDAFGEIIDYVTNLNEEEVDLVEVGAKLDTVLEKDSKIINREFVNSLITILIDNFAGDLGEELQPTLEEIKTNITSKEISFEKEFGAIKKLLDTFETLEGEELNLTELGKTLDEVIADSDIIDHEVINLAITVFIDEFTIELDENLKPMVEKIKNNITQTEISFEKEFGAIEKLLDTFENLEGEELNLTELGKTLDEVIAESDIIDNELISEAITVLVDEFTTEVDESLKPTVEDIKTKLTSSTISFEKELTAIQKLLDTFADIDAENPDLESIGKTLDEVIIDSDVIDHDLINNTIKLIIDEFTAEIDPSFKPTIDSIKNNLSGNLSYETECWAIQQLLEIIEVSKNQEIDLPMIGEKLDEVIVKSSIVNRELINSTILLLIDEATGNISADNQDTIDEIKEGFNRNDLVYKDEFLALDSLLNILDYANGNEVDLSNLGKQIDETLDIGSKIITHELINSTIQVLINEATSNVDNQYQETVNDIKNGFNGNDLVYETEFLALESLLDVINYAGSTEVDLSNVGKQIDETLALESKIITYDLINSCIQILIDEATKDVNSEHQNTISDIKAGFEGDDLVYETEFLALESLLDIFDFANGNGADLAIVGEKLDQTLTLGSKIITRSLINESIQILIDDATDSVSDEHSETIKDIKDGFNRLDLTYKTEFLALDSLLNIFDFAGSESVNLANVGEKLDQTLALNSKIITRSLINDSIQILINEATEGVSNNHQATITTIKNGFKRNDLTYKTEFLALESLLDVFDFAGSDNVNLANVGNKLDQTLELGSKIITRSLINSSVRTLIDEATVDVSDKHKGTITSIKNGFNRLDLTYETEFLALDSLLDVFDFAGNDNVNLANVGKQLDETLKLGSKIINRSLINSSVQVLIDEATEDVNNEYSGIVTDIKNGFNNNNLVYEDEFKALDTLLKVIDDANSVELKFIGQDLDYIVINVQSKVITRNLINSAIKVLIDDATQDISDTNVRSSINKIKNGFNRDDLSYELELTAIDKLIDTFDSANETSVNLPNFGKELDEVLALNGKIITKNLINEFIASSFDSFVTAGDISSAGSLSTSLSNIKNRVLDSNYQIASYQTEFTAIDKLVEISEVAGNLSISDIDKKLFDGNTKSIGEVFDDKIKDSVLLGDCGLNFIDSLIDTLNNQNSGLEGSRDYTKITSVISQNFEAIKPNVKCASNKNLNKSGTITYTQLAHSFAEIEHYLDDSAHKVTGQTEFTPDIAEYYESSLNTMQNNILLDKNGTRAVASYICGEIAVILEEKAQAIPFPDVASLVRSYKDIILTYKAYLERPATLTNNKLNEKEPYTTTGSTQYVTSTDGFKTNIKITNTKPSSNFAYRTNPFTSIAGEISALLP